MVPMAASILGKVTETMAAQSRLVATANPIPTSTTQNLVSSSLTDIERLTAMAERENLCRIGERNGSLSNRIEGGEDKDKHGNKYGMDGIVFDERAASRGE